jgi:exonuclease SbcD
MKILHTADIHLKVYGDERWEALRQLIEVGKQNQVDIFAICGDLFDENFDAENLRPQIRSLFSNCGFKILIIPGNHDSKAYEGGMYFGQDAVILDDWSKSHEDENVRFIGIPFKQMKGMEILNILHSLETKLTDDKTNILLYHGELLDTFFSRADFGEEGTERYMPIKLSYFEGANINYILGGHFHTKFDMRQLPNGGYFVYPGSPIPITKREVGQRKVNIFTVDEPPSEYLLDTPHFCEVHVDLDPLGDENPLEVVRNKLGGLHPKAKAILTIKGYVNSEKIHVSEPDLVAQIEQLIAGRCALPVNYEFKDIRKILEDDLFKGFMSKIAQADYTQERINRLREIAIKAMMGAGL